LVQTANGIKTLTVFDQNSLYVERTTGVNESVCGPVQGIEEHLKASTNDYPSYAMDIDYKVAIGAGVKFNAQFLSGIPERETNSDETDTTSTMPYRMFDIDFYGHTAGDPQAGYGSIPYITGHHSGDTTTSKHDEAFVWVNAADTWVDVVYLDDGSQFSGIVSESGVLEFFVYASSVSPKRICTNLAEISGHAPLPPLYSLGFHFSKYADVSADIMLQRNKDFNTFGFPVDVFWMDILYSDNYEYFKFDPVKFPTSKLDLMNTAVAENSRYLVCITDPHIKAADDFFVYEDGMILEQESTPTDVQSIFLHDCFNNTYFGDCWPGNSTYVDYFNENA
jgi:alpha 1,3-glucosidase